MPRTPLPFRNAATQALTPTDLLKLAQAAEPTLLSRLEALVRIESPSHDKPAVDRASALVVEWASALGAKVRRYRHRQYGDSLLATFTPRRQPKNAPILLLGHLDTVWPAGTLQSMPWQLTRDRVAGPGVLDMKAGVAMALAALEILLAEQALRTPVSLLLHGDEEIGSPGSRSVTESVAKTCRAVFVLEPAQGASGAYKTARKGVGHYRLEVKGISAHSGVDFERGHSAILELARQLERVAALTDLTRGLTVNPGVIGGGTLSNVIAAEAWAEIDVRVTSLRDATRVDRLLRKLPPIDKACGLSIDGGLNRPPMERSRAGAAFFLQAQKLASEIDLNLEEAATGGGSDGNFTAALGVPTLDGMGAVGEGAHAPHEHVLRAHLAPRTALLAAMLQQA
jgi:glutamate carboxypeptidase